MLTVCVLLVVRFATIYLTITLDTSVTMILVSDPESRDNLGSFDLSIGYFQFSLLLVSCHSVRTSYICSDCYGKSLETMRTSQQFCDTSIQVSSLIYHVQNLCCNYYCLILGSVCHLELPVIYKLTSFVDLTMHWFLSSILNYIILLLNPPCCNMQEWSSNLWPTVF